jgi:hypothetical protein
MADANSAFFRVLAGTGPTTVFSTGEQGERLFGQLPQPLAGTRPPQPPSAPVFRPNVPCELQQPPDLEAPAGPGDNTVRPTPTFDAAARARQRKAGAEIKLIETHLLAEQRGQPTIDPLEFSPRARRAQARRLGLERLPGGRYRERRNGR